MKTVERQLGQLQVEFGVFEAGLESKATKIMDDVMVQFAGVRIELDNVINSAKNEFLLQHQARQQLEETASASVAALTNRVLLLEAQGGGRGDGGAHTGYLPKKNTIPRKLDDKEEDWRQWKADVEDFLDEQNPGMKKFMEEIAKQKDGITEAWLQEMKGKYAVKITNDQVQVWRALKGLTEGEARKVINSVKDEDGFRAWLKLNARFEPGLAVKQGMVLADFSGMILKPAKNTAETKALITEMERKMKIIDEVSNEPISDNHARSVLIGILDPITKVQTAMHHGDSTDFDKLRRIVMEFTNNMTTSANPMQIGSVGEKQDDHQVPHQDESQGANNWDYPYTGDGYGADTQQANGLGKGGGGGSSVQCFNCGGYGHIARNCSHPPSKGKGKGKTSFGPIKGDWRNGKGKGADQQQKGQFGGKGKGKGPVKGCYTCGGAHYQSDCPQKGGGKGLRTLDGWTQDEGYWVETGEIKTLSSICTAGEKGKNENQCQLCMVEEVDSDNEGMTNLVDSSDSEPGHQADKDEEDEDDDSDGEGDEGIKGIIEIIKAMHEREDIKKNKKKLMRNNKKIKIMSDLINIKNKDIKNKDNEMITQNDEIKAEDEEKFEIVKSKTAKRKERKKRIKREKQEEIKILQVVEPEGVNAVGKPGEWQEIEMAVDSGATETVMGEDMLTEIEIKPGMASKRGVKYEVANGTRIPNLGERKFIAHSEEGAARNITAQVCDVNKALLSVKKVVGAGNKVVFDDSGSYIEDKRSGERMWLREENGMYMLKMYVRTPF